MLVRKKGLTVTLKGTGAAAISMTLAELRKTTGLGMPDFIIMLKETTRLIQLAAIKNRKWCTSRSLEMS